MFSLRDENKAPDSADPLSYERSILTPLRPRMSQEVRSPGTFEVARLNGKPITISYQAAQAPSGALKLVEIVIGGVPVLNSCYQAGEVVSFLAEVSDALIAAGIAKGV